MSHCPTAPNRHPLKPSTDEGFRRLAGGLRLGSSHRLHWGVGGWGGGGGGVNGYFGFQGLWGLEFEAVYLRFKA